MALDLWDICIPYAFQGCHLRNWFSFFEQPKSQMIQNAGIAPSNRPCPPPASSFSIHYKCRLIYFDYQNNSSLCKALKLPTSQTEERPEGYNNIRNNLINYQTFIK
jgi:hypothetical protein